MIRLDGYVHALNSLRDELFNLHHIQGLSWREIANMERFQGISHIMLWRIDQGYDPKGKTREMLGLPPIRVRLAADVSEEQRAALQRHAERCGNKSWSDYCQEWAENLLMIEMLQDMSDGLSAAVIGGASDDEI